MQINSEKSLHVEGVEGSVHVRKLVACACLRRSDLDLGMLQSEGACVASSCGSANFEKILHQLILTDSVLVRLLLSAVAYASSADSPHSFTLRW